MIAVIAAFALAFTLLPGRARAFWPFSNANAQGTPTPLLHDNSITLLQAAVNTDPNPTKGDAGTKIVGGMALAADDGPSGTMADIADAPKTDRISLYVVRAGDSMADIADMFGVSSNTIIWANNLKNAKDIHVGDTLLILPVNGVKKTIVKGDSLASLAKKYGADVNEIAQFNGLDPADALVVGSVLIIPGGELAALAATVKSGSKSTGSSKASSLINPYRGGSGPNIDGYFADPMPGAILTQGIHGWNGIDLSKPKGTPILAAAAGTVIVARSSGWNGGYGEYVVITHDNGTQTLYGHMSKVAASVGDSVAQGEVIGYEGATGIATGPHLHFEVRGAKNPFGDCVLNKVCN